MAWLGIDVGGANLKAADSRGYAATRAFAIWRAPRELANELRALLAAAPAHEHIAATMTAELADCFETKADGVRAIVDALVEAAGDRKVAIYTTAGEFTTPGEAISRPLAAAASNWHALAAFAVRFASERPAVLIDIGSTTADIIPLDGQRPAAQGTTDTQRLQSGELVYTGVERTAVATILAAIPWRGRACPVASELFATAGDAHLLLGDIPENADDRDTADGRPRTRDASRARLARMICADTTMFGEDDALAAADAIRAAQVQRLTSGLTQVVRRMPRPPATVIRSGHGEFLGRKLVREFPWGDRPPEMLSLNKALGPLASRCATALAVAVLAEERLGAITP